MGKDKNLFAFLRSVKSLSVISLNTLNKLAFRFGIEPDSLSILICLYGGVCKHG
jgi:hypothetical protein